ncbi:MAG: stage III sporulation protein AB [Oscillospiraceae bacterium]
MKLLGAFLLVFACTWFGVEQARRLFLRQKCLGGMVEALRFMEAELKNNAVSLPELFEELGRVSRREVRGFFLALSESMASLGEKSLTSLWSACVMNEGSLSLSSLQRSELTRPGLSLGRYAGQEQLIALESCAARLETELLRASENARQGAKLYTGLGLIGGLMLATAVI